jgi:hypothetical protein
MSTVTSYALRTARIQQAGALPTLRDRLSGTHGLSYSVQGSQSTEDIKVSLSSRRRSTSVEIKSAEAAISEAEKPNPLRDMLKQFSKITESLRSLRKELSQAESGTDRQTQLQNEYLSTVGEYQRLLEGADFKRLITVNQHVNNILNSGGRPQDLYRALLPEQGLLGIDYLSRVASGDVAALQQFTSNLDALTKINPLDLINDPTALDKIDSAVDSALRSLLGPQVTPSKTAQIKPSEAKARLEAPKLTQVQFESNSGIGIGLQTYLGTDAIQAALAHVPLDPQNVLRLVYNPDEDVGKDKHKEHEKRKELERFSRSQGDAS